jgi:hypothetical protein
MAASTAFMPAFACGYEMKVHPPKLKIAATQWLMLGNPFFA